MAVNTTQLRLVLVVGCIVLLQACQSADSASYQVSFDQDVVLIFGNEAKQPVKNGEVTALKPEPVTIARPGHASMLLVPIPAEGGALHLHLAQEDKADAAAGKLGAQLSATEENNLVRAVVDIQGLLAANRPDEALARLQAVREKNPRVSYLRFLEGSCFLVKHDFARAEAIVASALREFPEDPAGQALLAELKKQGGPQAQAPAAVGE